MTKVQNPITGRSKGQAGGMVFTTLYGANVIKAKPYSYRDANTEVQRTNRSLHLSLVRAAASQKNNVRGLFYQQPANMSAYSRLVQQLQGLYNRESGSPIFDGSGKEIGSGNVDVTFSETTYDQETGIITLVIDNSKDLSLPAGATSDHDLYLYNKTTNQFEVLSGTLTHATHTFSATSIEKPDTADVIAFFAYNNAKSGPDLQKGVKRGFVLSEP